MDDNYNQNNGYVNPSDEVEVLDFNLNQEPANNQNAEQQNDKKRIIIIAAVVFIIILVILLIILSSSSSSVKKIDSKYFWAVSFWLSFILFIKLVQIYYFLLQSRKMK